MTVEIFKTDVNNPETAFQIIERLLQLFPSAHATFDLDDCDNILRFADYFVNPEAIILTVSNLGVKCELLAD